MHILRKLIREVIEIQRLEEINQEKLLRMFNNTATKIKQLNPQTTTKETIHTINQDIQHISSIDMDAGEQLLRFFKDKKEKVYSTWKHVPQRTPMHGKRGAIPMPSHKRPQRNA